MMDLSLLQPHTVKIYNLAEADHEVATVPARSLLTPRRFDLFAKLYYIAHRDEDSKRALEVYSSHILAFNPDGREPGRDDKDGVDNFVRTFDSLIAQFEAGEFEPSQSVVPVDGEGVILDGAHRVAALAYYDRVVTIARFPAVRAKANFDSEYFKRRGLPWAVCDTVAQEMCRWLPAIYAACLWPRLTDKHVAVEAIASRHTVAYRKDVPVSLAAVKQFVAAIYGSQPWTQSDAAVADKALRCYGHGGRLTVMLFTSTLPLDDIIAWKDDLRTRLGHGKDTVHITDNADETMQVASLVLAPAGAAGALPVPRARRWMERLRERWHYFKHVELINLKVAVSRLIHAK